MVSFQKSRTHLILLAHAPETLRIDRRAVAEFLSEQLGLVLRRDGDEPRRATAGIEFVGWRTWWPHRVPRARTVEALHARVGSFARTETTSLFRGRARRIAWREGPVAALRGSLASYAGHLQHGASARAWQRVWTDSSWLGACFRRHGWWRFAPRWPIAPVVVPLSFGVRYRRVVSALGDRALVFWGVGRYVEFRGPGLGLAVSVLGLRRVVLPRGGYRYAAGFPWWLLGRYLRRAVRAGMVVVLTMGVKGVVALVVPARACCVAREV